MPELAIPEIKLPKVELNIYTPKDPVEVPVVENRIVTKESSPNFIRHISFDVSGTDLEGRIHVGQAFGIVPPGTNEKTGRPYKLRLYSMASPFAGEDGNGTIISTTVKRVIEEWDEEGLYLGVCSNYLCDLKPGDKVKMTGPSGRRFLLPENKEEFNYIFFAAGTGIAPFRGMVKELLDAGVKKDIVLIFGCPYRTDILYPDYFEEMAEKHPNFHFLVSVSREDRRADGSKKYVQTQLVDRKDLLSPILAKENTLMYICGLKGMESAIYRRLALDGFSDYLDIKEKIQDKSPEEWDEHDFLRNIKPGERSFVEVY